MLSTPPAFILSQDQTLMLKCLSCQMSSGITVCLSCSISRTCPLNNSWISYKILMESSGLHYCLFVKVLRCLSRDSLFNISQPSALVNNFFIFFAVRLSFQKCILKRRNLIANGERGIWTLAPVARPTPLAGAPLRPLEYFSIIRITSLPNFFCVSNSWRKIHYT